MGKDVGHTIFEVVRMWGTPFLCVRMWDIPFSRLGSGFSVFHLIAFRL